MSLHSKIQAIQAKMKENVVEDLDKVLTDVAFLDQDEVNIKELTWDRDIDEDERIVIMTESDYDKYCDVINIAKHVLDEIKHIPLRRTFQKYLTQATDNGK